MFASLMLSLSLVVAAPAADAVPVLDEDAEVSVEYDLVIDLADSEIDVDMAVDVTYTKPREQDGNRIIRFFMTEWHAFLPSSAEAITASDSEGPLSYTVEPVEQPGLVLVKVDFRRDLSSGESLALDLSYSLPSEPPPIELNETVELILEDQVVVNDAAVAWAFYSDPRADRWTAEFELPPGFVGPLNGDLWRERDGTRTLEASGDDFRYDFIVIENDAAMTEHVVPFDGHEITVRHWPGDDAWRELVSRQIVDRLPQLIDMVGGEWPDRALVVQQSARTLGTSYGGWYAGGDHRITIGRSVNPELILHELSHVWFQYENLDDRWLIEGLADEFAALAADGPNGESEPQVSLSDEHAVDLDDWTDPASIQDTITSPPEAERWAYQAAWYVTRTTREIIGLEAFTEVIEAILGGARSYPGPEDGTAASGDVPPRDWREFLDLVSDHGQNSDDGRQLAELYSIWVEGSWTDEFESRSEARNRFRSLQESSGATAPAAVRDPMRDWNFEDADTAMAATEGLLTQVEATGRRLAERDLSIPSNVNDQLARLATTEEIVAYQAELVAASDDIVDFIDRADGTDGWQRVGLIASDLGDTRAAALDAFSTGDFEYSARFVDDGRVELEAAGRRGRFRTAVAISVAALLVLGAFLRNRRTGARQANSAVVDLTEQSNDTVDGATAGRTDPVSEAGVASAGPTTRRRWR